MDALRDRWIDQGEWSQLLITVAGAVAELRKAERMKLEQARAEGEAEAGHAFAVAAAVPDASASAPSPLLARYNELLQLLLSLLLRCGRIYHGIVLDFNLLQDQLLPFFGSFAQSSPSDTDNAAPASSNLQPGPFWMLAADQQHVASQLLYYFDALSPSLLQLLLACMRHPELPLPPKLLLLDLIEDKFHQSNSEAAASEPGNALARWSVGSYVSFILGLIRPTVPPTMAVSAAGVSPLMEVACKMLRGITEVEIDAALQDTMPVAAAPVPQMPVVVRGARVVMLPQPAESSEVMIVPSSPVVLLELLAPLLSSTLHSSLSPSSSEPSGVPFSALAAVVPPQLDLLSTLILLDSLLEHAGRSAVLPPSLGELVPSACYFLLSRSLTGSMVEGGLVRAHAGWTSAPLVGFVSAGQPWMVALRVLHATAARGALKSVLASMARAFTAGTQPQNARAQERAVVVLVALTKCARIREMLQQPQHQAAVLALAASIQRHTGIASQTLLAALHSELALLFGQQAAM